MNFDPENLLPEEEYGRLVGRAIVTLRRDRREGRSPAFIRIGRTVYYARKDIADWMQANRTEPRYLAKSGAQIAAYS